MEKYSKWRDPGTGIQPFLPPLPPRVDSSLFVTLSTALRIVVGPLQGTVKILLIAALALLYVLLVPLLGTVLTIIPPLKRLWNNVWTCLLIRLVLFLMGFFHIKTETVSIRKSRESNRTETPKVQHGDIIVANWTSYVEILYLAFKYNPIFTQVYTNSEKVKPIGLWEAIRSACKMPESEPASPEELYTVRELSDRARKGKWGPLVVFPEGTTTNGRALLKFSPLFKDYPLNQHNDCFKVMAFKYDYGNMPPPFTVGYQFAHFFKLCSQFHNTMLVKILARGEAPCSSQTTAATVTIASANATGDALITVLGNMAKLRKTNLSMSDKRDFLAYYKSRTSQQQQKSRKRS